jgi:hypothetical protein
MLQASPDDDMNVIVLTGRNFGPQSPGNCPMLPAASRANFFAAANTPLPLLRCNNREDFLGEGEQARVL